MNAVTLTLIGLLAVGIGLMGYALINLATVPEVVENTPGNYQQQFVAAAAEMPDKCKIPDGYTKEAWVEHLGHHPDRYADCFQYFQ